MRPLTRLGATILAAAALLAGTPAQAVLVDGMFSGILNNNQPYEISFSADVVAFEDDSLFSLAPPGFETSLSVVIDGVEVFNAANASVNRLGFTGGELSSLEIYGDNFGPGFRSSDPPDFAYIILSLDPITFPTFGQTNIVQLGNVFTQRDFVLPTSFDVTVSGAFAVPVPVPASWTLLVPALVGLGAAAVGVRRRCRSARCDTGRPTAGRRRMPTPPTPASAA